MEATEEPTAEPTVTPEPPVVQPEDVENNQTIDTFTETVMDEIAGDEQSTVEVIVPVEPLKEAVDEETFAKIEELTPDEKIIVVLAALGNSGEQNSLTDNADLGLSEETEALVKEVTKAVSNMDVEERKAFEEMIAEQYPSQEVEIDGKVYVYYLIPMEIRTEEGVEIRYYAFCYDEEQKTWLFTLVKPGEEITDLLTEGENISDL